MVMVVKNVSLVFVYQFVIIGVYGETPKTDIAIDAVCITACTGNESSMI